MNAGTGVGYAEDASDRIELDASREALFLARQPIDRIVNQIREYRVERGRIAPHRSLGEGVRPHHFDIVSGHALSEQVGQELMDFPASYVHGLSVQPSLKRGEERQVSVKVVETAADAPVERHQLFVDIRPRFQAAKSRPDGADGAPNSWLMISMAMPS